MDLAMEPVMPAPAAEFSAFAITKSMPRSVRSRDSLAATISRPGRPNDVTDKQ